jgi:uracil-DNA glycosylase
MITVTIYSEEKDNMGQNELNYQFPFGQCLQEVKQTDKTPKKIFVLGVYASAVHAKWCSPEGKEIVKALAVASEPYIFWKGEREDAERIISEIKIPKEAGYLNPADDQFNGPSGRALDDMILRPLGYSRNDAWLCDLVPYSCQNENQEKALKKNYIPIKAKFGLPAYSIPQPPKILTDEARVNDILKEILESQAETIIFLGDEPIKWFLRIVSNCKAKKLADFKDYGAIIKATISGKEYNVISLAHPRQIAALGKSNKKWYMKHQQWMQTRK